MTIKGNEKDTERAIERQKERRATESTIYMHIQYCSLQHKEHFIPEREASILTAYGICAKSINF